MTESAFLNRGQLDIVRLVWMLVALVLALMTIFPLLWMLSISFKPPVEVFQPNLIPMAPTWDNFLYVLFHSDNAKGGDLQNVAFYRDDTVDKLLIDAQAVADEGARSELYAAVQDKIAADAPWVPIAHSELVVAGRAELEGVVLSPTGNPVYALIRRPGAR